jgi:hypothetical protein
MTTSQNMDKQIDAGFEVFWSDFSQKIAALQDPYMPDTLKAAMQRTLKEVYSAGFASAYASYIVALYSRGGSDSL